MSYSMSLSEQKFSISPEHMEQLLKILTIKFKVAHEQFTKKEAAYKYLPPALQIQKLSNYDGFELIPNADESGVEKVGWHGLGMLGGEEKLLEVIAKFVTAGSFIEMTGEDGCQWRYVFDGTKVKKIHPKIVWEE